jgi:hypothetical protein
VVARWADRAPDPERHDTDTFNKRLYWGMTLAVCTLLLLVKPMLGLIIQDPIPLILLTCLVHTLMLCTGMLVLLHSSAGQDTDAGHCTLHWTVPVLTLGVIGVLIANLIDFALFEPGVLTCFWVMIACLVATYQVYRGPDLQPRPVPCARPRSMTAGIVAVLLLCAALAYGPIMLSTASIHAANQAWADHDTEQAHQALDLAARQDWLSDTALYQNGRMYLQEYNQSSNRPETLLHRARTCFEQAILRNPGAYRNHERLADVCTLMDPNEAIEPAQQASELYPGNARLRVKLAMLYDELGQTDQALEAYQVALDIENQFQDQFKIMYPDETVIHRLEKSYLDAALAGLEEGKKVRR